MGLRAAFLALRAREDLKGRAIQGTAFTILIFGSQNALRLASNLILTRILFPEAFGLMAIVFLIQAGLNCFSDLGIRASIIQDKDGEEPLFLDTAWGLQILRGILLYIVLWLLAAPAAAFYEQPSLEQILPVIAIGTFIQGFNSTNLPSAERALKLGRVALLETSSQVIGLIINVALAYWLQTVWALVYGYVLSTIIYMLLTHTVLHGHANRFKLHGPYVRRMISFGAFVFLASIAGFLVSQGDRAILAKIATLEELAFYNIAYFLASVPLLLLRALVDKVLFPLYASRPPRESETNRINIARLRMLITAGCVFGLIVLAVIGNPLVQILYDPRYEAAGAFMVLIALALLPSVISGSYSYLALAAGESRRFATLTILQSVVYMLAILTGGYVYGIGGVIGGLAVAPILFHPLLIWMIRPYKGWDPIHDGLFTGLSIAAVAVLMATGIMPGFLP